MYPIFNSKIHNDKPILLIGNSPCVRDQELGEYINLSNFNIIRFNLSKVRGYEKYVGKGTSFRVINGITWNSNREKIPLENILISELPHTPQYNILCKYPTNLKFKSVHILPNYSRKYLRNYPTSGMMAIAFFLQFYKCIFIYGFSFSDSHYYNSNLNKGASHHSYKNEKKAIFKLKKFGRIKFLNDEDCSQLSSYGQNLKTVVFKNDYSNPVTDTSNNIIKIVSTNHVWNKTRNYFHFNSKDINLTLGDTIFLRGIVMGTQKFISIVVWGYNNGGIKGDSHGRSIDENISFQEGDKISILETIPTIKVLCTEHKFGSDFKGMYFHFDPENKKFKNEQEYLCYIPKINMKKKIVIWTKRNGGTSGRMHGRYVKGSKKYDFYKDDLLVLLSNL